MLKFCTPDLAMLQAVLSEHSAEVVGVALHPTNKYFITASADKSWAFYDLDSMLCMAQVLSPLCVVYFSQLLCAFVLVCGLSSQLVVYIVLVCG